MISYITIGVDDIAKAKQFYSAFLPTLGYEIEVRAEGLSCTFAPRPGQPTTSPDLYIKLPFDEGSASAGNGSMIAFHARNQKQVRDLYAAAIAAGGTDDGGPGFRAAYGPHFYVAYLRDPQGNKVAIFSNDRNEPSRDG